jgi:2-keto-4-pentenoate hydratase/2-oxohepta-3-ene-1,7-dioic acid hydratase in catechol pathway
LDAHFPHFQCVNDPCGAISVPAIAPSPLDAKVELAVIISKDCTNVDEATALNYVLRYTVANDVTARDVQARVSQWGFSKGYDGFCPLGPVIVRADAPGFDVKDLKMTTTLNGETLQHGNSSEMIFSVGSIVSYLSQDTTLPAGTVIITGTPSGIGHSYKPPKYLGAGDNLQVSIGGGLGTLVNPIV